MYVYKSIFVTGKQRIENKQTTEDRVNENA